MGIIEKMIKVRQRNSEKFSNFSYWTGDEVIRVPFASAVRHPFCEESAKRDPAKIKPRGGSVLASVETLA
jgi:hypothetical protein